MKRLAPFLVLLILFIPAQAHAAIAVGNAVANGYGAGGGTLTVAGTVNAGTNLCLFATVNAYDSTNITSVTWHGVSMSQIGSFVRFGTTNNWIGTYYLINPDVGSFNLVANRSDSDRTQIASYTLTGCKQSGQPDASASGSNTGSTPVTSFTNALTTVADNSWVVFSAAANVTDISGTTNVTSRSTNTGNGEIFIGDSNAAKTPAGSFSQKVSFSSSVAAWIQFSVAPAPDVVNPAASFQTPFIF